MSRYRAGYRLEHRVQNIYAKYGWLVTRFPASGRQLHHADILAVKRVGIQTLIHLIECKNASKIDQKKKAIYIEAEQIKKLLEIAKRHQAHAFIAYSFPHLHARIVKANKLRSSGEMFFIKQEEGIPIRKFIKSIT